MNESYRVGVLPPTKWSELSGRLANILVSEFKDPKEWEVIPSMILLMGAVFLTRGGVKRQAMDEMITKYLAAVDKAGKASAN